MTHESKKLWKSNKKYFISYLSVNMAMACRILLPQGLQLGNTKHELQTFYKINYHVHTEVQLTSEKRNDVTTLRNICFLCPWNN